MKKMIKTILFVMLTGISVQSMAQEKIIQAQELPKQAQSFIKTYYPQDVITLVTSEKEFFKGTEYSVKLKSGTEVEFDKNGNWTELDAKLKPVPQALIPNKIKEYISRSFPNNEVVQIKTKSNLIEVELTNGIDLEFNKKGEFLRIDD